MSMFNTDALIDELGALNAEIADLQAEAKAMKIALQDRIVPGMAREGDLYRASHSVAERDTVDWKAVAGKLKPSRQLVAAHTKRTEVHTIRVVGRSAKAA